METLGGIVSVTSKILWRVYLFDGPKLESLNGAEITRFKSQRVGALLAYLALKLGHPCSRDELCYALWPDEDDSKVTANRLRVALSSLRRQLEPPNINFGSVLDNSQPGCLRLRSDTVWCDVVEANDAIKACRPQDAQAYITGELLPGYYDDWAVDEQQRFGAILAEMERQNVPTVNVPSCFANNPYEVPESTFHLPLPRFPLPLYLTRCFGRVGEINELTAALQSDRLVSIVGPGGMGKTRLAVEYASQMTGTVVFVSLVTTGDQMGVIGAMLQALNLLVTDPSDSIEQIVSQLQKIGSAHLILDNVEEVVAEAAETAMQLLKALPNLKILATGRKSLDIIGEKVFQISPLGFSEPNSQDTISAVSPALALFLDRAQRVLPGFALTAKNTPDILDICRKLEGVPLAIELAAVRVTLQTPAQISSDLSQNLLILKSRQRGLARRHQSLRATLQVSFDLLNSEQKNFFATLSVFRGGWTVEAAEAVSCSEDASEHLEDLLLCSLVNVTTDSKRGIVRYTFLESIRQFATEQCTEEQRSLLVKRHCRYFLGLSAKAIDDEIQNFFPLDVEKDNILLALETGWREPSSSFWGGLLGALKFMYYRGLHRVAIPWVEAVLPLSDQIVDRVLKSQVLDIFICLLNDTGRMEQGKAIALKMQQDGYENGDLTAATLASTRLGYIESELGDCDRSIKIHREALQQARRLNSLTLVDTASYLTARALLVAASKSKRESNSTILMLEEALGLSLEATRELSPNSIRLAYWQLLTGVCRIHLRRQTEAYQSIKSAQRASITHEVLPILMYALFYESLLALRMDHPAYAALLHGGFREIQDRMGYQISISAPDQLDFEALTVASIGQSTFDALAALGRRIPPQILVEATIENPPSILLNFPNSSNLTR